MFFVYVLRSERDGGYYHGMTADLEARVRRHNAGGVRSTKNRHPLRLVYYERCETRGEARRREKFFKSGPGHRYLEAKMELADASRQERGEKGAWDKSG